VSAPSAARILSARSLTSRIRGDRAFSAGMGLVTALAVAPLLFIVGYVLFRGAAAIDWRFLTTLPKPMGEEGGGIANALLGSGIVVAIAGLVAVPLGVFAGIFLAESRHSRVAPVARLSVEVLMGLPSIVIGVIAWLWLVRPMKSFSGLSGGVALAMIMLPVVTLATEETLRLIPVSLREASLALGVSYPRTVLKVLVPAAASGIVTGILLGVARALGETAPLLFTAFGSPYLVTSPLKPMETLPHAIFTLATSPYDSAHLAAWGASFILMVLVLSLNLLTRLVTARWNVKF
jgi:phosphate transport system permease protein